jgi:hypothetical protein
MKTVVVDMDGVICEERPTFERSLAKPLRDARDRLAAMRDDGHRIIIHTARSWSELAMTEEWLYEHGIVYDQLVMGKPVADVVVDDRAVTSLEEAEGVTAGDTSKKPVAESPKQLREPVAWRVYATDGSEVVYSLYEQARAAAADLNWSVEPLYRSGENTPDPHATPGEGISHCEGTSQPVAWAVLLEDGQRIYDVYAIEEDAKAIDEAVTGNHGVVPLYRQPPTCPYVVGRTTLHCSLTPFTLTDAERQYITCQANRAWHNASEADARGDADWAKWHRDEERTLRSLLERTK